MTTPEAALAAILASHQHRDGHYCPPLVYEPGIHIGSAAEFAADLLAALHDAGYALTPLAPEVPPRRDGLREQLANLGRLAAGPAHRRDLLRDWARFHAEELANIVAATRTPEPPDSGPYEARVIEGSQGPMWEVIEHGAAEAECLAGEEGAKRIAAALNRAGPPDSGDGAARSRSVIRRENVQAGRPMNEGIEPPDSGDGADILQAATGGPDFTVKEWPPRDAGIDAAELVSLVEDAIGRFRQAGRDNTALWFENALARLRSGSPAPEGGE